MKKDQQYLRVFNHMDADKDGKLSPRELQQRVVLLSIGEQNQISIEDAEAALMSVDSDGDGYLCLEEFMRLVEGGGDEERNNDLKEAFKMYEVEGGGYIDPLSLKKMLSRLGESKTVQQCRNMIAHFDINGDGILSFDEFITMMS